MKQAIYYGTKDVRVVEAPLPEIGDNDVLVKTYMVRFAVLMFLHIITVAHLQE